MSNFIKRILLLISILSLLFISNFNNIGLFENITPEYAEFINGNKMLIVWVGYIFQTVLLFITMSFEVLVLFFAVRIILKKKEYVKVYVSPVLFSTLIVIAINTFLPKLLFPGPFDMEIFKAYTLLSPINIIKPFILCYFLYRKGILSKQITDWLLIGGVYLLIAYLPSLLFIIFFF